MDDEPLIDRIETLVEQEQELLARGQRVADADGAQNPSPESPREGD